MLYRTTCSAVLGTYPGSTAARHSVTVIFEADEAAESIPVGGWRQALALAWQVDVTAVDISAVQDGATLAAAAGSPTLDGIYRGVLGLSARGTTDCVVPTPPEFPLCMTRPHVQTQLWMVWSNHVLRSWPMPWHQGELYAINDACMRELRRYLKSGDPKGHEKQDGFVTNLWTVLLKLHYVLLGARLDLPNGGVGDKTSSMSALAGQVAALTKKGPDAWPSFPSPYSALRPEGPTHE